MNGSPSLTQSIGQAENALRAILDRVLAKTGLNYIQWVTLSMIARSGPAVPQEKLVQQLGNALKLDDVTVRSTLLELSRQGRIDVRNGDAPLVTLTAIGDAQFGELRQHIERVTERLYGDLKADELATTRRVLEIVTTRANAELGR